MQQNTTALQPTLEEISAHFKHWRQIKRNHREPIPKKLWQEAIDLTRQYQVSNISKELRLGYTDFKERVRISSVPKPTNTEINPDFIELKYEQPFLLSEATVEIEDKNGTKMKICFKGKPDLDLMNLAKAFLGKI
ncbi:MAG: hypothetical protein ACYCZ1_03605 [Candidatus Humimicrobiaceae bacterium]